MKHNTTRILLTVLTVILALVLVVMLGLAGILSLKDALESEIDMASVPAYIAGVVVSAVVGYICIRLLKAIAAKGRFGAFAYYCWAVGALVLIFTAL